mgnify:CR=1 FL=1
MNDFFKQISPNPMKTKLGKWVGSRVRRTISGLRKKGGAEARIESVGRPPGIEFHPEVGKAPRDGEIPIKVTDFGETTYGERRYGSVDAFLAEEGGEEFENRWVDVSGLHPYVINQLRDRFGFHTLAAEDVFNVPQRPKVEDYEGNLFVVARAVLPEESGVSIEQVSFLFFPEENLLLSFRETSKDALWKRISERIEKPGSRLRTLGVAYLLYALLDALTDLAFPVLEHEEDVLDALEEACLGKPDPKTQEVIHSLRREMLQIRRSLVPMKEMLEALHRNDAEALAPEVVAFVRDVLDHALQAIEMLDANRARANDLHDFYMTVQAHHMNEVMKVLTIMASFFIPITFVAGVYGMNFEFMPELGYKYSYPIFWGSVLLIIGGLFVFFRRKGWF